jgi:hypothetical protein
MLLLLTLGAFRIISILPRLLSPNNTPRLLLLARLGLPAMGDERTSARAQEVKNPSAMSMAAIGMARVCGLIIDRREVGDVGAFSGLSDEELLRTASERAARLGLLRDPGDVGPKLVVDNRSDFMCNDD